MTWNPLALATALQTVPEQNIDVTNSESALIIKMNDYGMKKINIALRYPIKSVPGNNNRILF